MAASSGRLAARSSLLAASSARCPVDVLAQEIANSNLSAASLTSRLYLCNDRCPSVVLAQEIAARILSAAALN